VVIIVNNGLARFGVGAFLTIFGTAIRGIAAVGFVFFGDSQLLTWAMLYAAANAFSFLFAALFFYPKVKLRWTPKAYIGRMRDAFSVSAAEVLFYLQMELDKILVLAVGGETTAGLYAIIMRLVDLTALPIRAFNTLLVQLMMKNRGGVSSLKTRILTEGAIAAISTGGLTALVILLNIAPGILGNSIGQASGFLVLVLAVPAFRNLVEYHAELLYAREQTMARAVILGLVGLLKAGLLILLLGLLQDFAERALWLNAVFIMLYLLSAFATYGIAMKMRQGKDKT
jgi:O-antigen/teichoic acid export membrane protein